MTADNKNLFYAFPIMNKIQARTAFYGTRFININMYVCYLLN